MSAVSTANACSRLQLSLDINKGVTRVVVTGAYGSELGVDAYLADKFAQTSDVDVGALQASIRWVDHCWRNVEKQ